MKLYERLTVKAPSRARTRPRSTRCSRTRSSASYPAAKAILDAYVEDLAGLLPPLS